MAGRLCCSLQFKTIEIEKHLFRYKDFYKVLTSAAMLDINYAKEHEISHKIINAYDVPSYKMTPHFEEAFIFIEESLKKGNILVHCSAGISRVIIN